MIFFPTENEGAYLIDLDPSCKSCRMQSYFKEAYREHRQRAGIRPV